MFKWLFGRRKKSADLLVRLHDGGSFMFDGDLRWGWDDSWGTRRFWVTKDEKLMLECPADNLQVVTGPITLFEKRWWK